MSTRAHRRRTISQLSRAPECMVQQIFNENIEGYKILNSPQDRWRRRIRWPFRETRCPSLQRVYLQEMGATTKADLLVDPL